MLDSSAAVGRFDQEGDADWYRMKPPQERRVSLEIAAQRHLRAPVDTLVEVFDADGKRIEANDDGKIFEGETTHDFQAFDSYLAFTARGGPHFVRVSEQTGARGPRAVYRLTARARGSARLPPRSLARRRSGVGIRKHRFVRGRGHPFRRVQGGRRNRRRRAARRLGRQHDRFHERQLPPAPVTILVTVEHLNGKPETFSLAVNRGKSHFKCNHDSPVSFEPGQTEVAMPLTLPENLEPGAVLDVVLTRQWRSDVRGGLPGPCTRLIRVQAAE